METRKNKIENKLSEYIESRKDIFKDLCSSRDEDHIKKLIHTTHTLTGELFSYFTPGEKDVMQKEIQKIVKAAPGCQNIEKHFRDCSSDMYLECLDHQHEILSEMINFKYVDTIFIADTVGGISTCHSDYYYDGECH